MHLRILLPDLVLPLYLSLYSPLILNQINRNHRDVSPLKLHISFPLLLLIEPMFLDHNPPDQIVRNISYIPLLSFLFDTEYNPQCINIPNLASINHFVRSFISRFILLISFFLRFFYYYPFTAPPDNASIKNLLKTQYNITGGRIMTTIAENNPL